MNLERDAGGPHDDADRLLAKRALIGGHDSVEARFIVVVAGQHDLDVLAGLMHDPAAVAIAPLSDRIGHGQAVGEARHHFARDEARPIGFAHADTVTDVAAEQQFGDFLGLLRAVTGSSTPPQGSARLATKRGLVTVTVDGGAVDGAVPGAWAKYAIPKGLPEEEGQRRMTIENVPHRVDDFDGVIAEGYGKGLKKLVYSGTVAVKIDGETALRKINIHRHEADRAGMHYDLVCEGVPMGTERWELSIPNGPFKGRYAFVDASGAMSSGEYNEGRLVTRMRDRGVRLDKPDYRLKDRAWL